MVKMSPLVLLCLVAIALVAIIIFFHCYDAREGFISFNEGVVNGAALLDLTEYTTKSTATVYKVFDNIYLDSVNGNLVYVYSPAYDGMSKDIDNTGATITAIDVIPRTGLLQKKYTPLASGAAGTTIVDQTIVGTALVGAADGAAGVSWISTWSPSTAVGGEIYQVLYCSMGAASYVHAYSVVGKFSTIAFAKASAAATPAITVYNINTPTVIAPASSIADSSSANGTFLGATDASNKPHIALPSAMAKIMYQISKNVCVHFGAPAVVQVLGVAASAGVAAVIAVDPVAAIPPTIIIYKMVGTVRQATIYNLAPDTTGNAIALYADVVMTTIPVTLTAATSAATADATKSWSVVDTDGGNLVVVGNCDTKVVVSVLSPSSSDPRILSIRGVYAFDKAAVLAAMSAPTVTAASPLFASGAVPAAFVSLTAAIAAPQITVIPPVVPPVVSPVVPPADTPGSGDGNIDNGLGSVSGGNPPSLDDIIDTYYSRYWNSGRPDPSAKYSSDYLLKTQLIPPICPACPQCPSSGGACTNCGGSGGNGTYNSSTGESLAAGTSTKPIVNGTNAVKDVALGVTDVVGTTALGAELIVGGTIAGAGNIIGDAVNNTGNFASSAAKGTGNFAAGAANGTGNFAAGAANGAGSLLTNAANGTGNIINNAINGTGNALNGAGDFVGDTLRGTGRVLSGNGNSGYSGSGNSGNSMGRGVSGNYAGDVQNNAGYAGGGSQQDYGGYGYPPSNMPVYNNGGFTNGLANPRYVSSSAQTSNFIPITTSFSAFGK